MSQQIGYGILFLLAVCPVGLAAEVTGVILNAKTDKPLPARVYVQASDGEWLFVKSATPQGSALAYREQWVPMPMSVEKHTTVSAHPFRIDLKPGEYTVTIERGKEYFALTRKVIVTGKPQRETFRLRRWINLAERGWYSGETHVHRRIHELPNVMLAEDLNVAFPVTFWTIDAFATPGLEPSTLRRQGPSPFGPREDRGHALIAVDDTHVMFPRNTEYEIFSIGKKRHVLGAVFVLNHRTVFRDGMPPVAEIARRAHEEGALLDLDKHSWPWSMMLVPVAKVDLYELSNNSVWRTKFGFRRSSVKPGTYMDIERDKSGFTEWGWLQFGFENYYTLLNCGFRLQPTAGTASGVHPVPLGHSRVYVHVDRFTGQSWIDGLKAGRSFVTTGPMLFAKVNGQHPGHVFNQKQRKAQEYKIEIEAISDRELDRIEIVRHGQIQQTLRPGREYKGTRTADGAFRVEVSASVFLEDSSWIAVRCIQRQEDRRIRFAHTAPWHIEVGDQPIKPRRAEIEYLIGRIQIEIERNKDVLPPAALREYKQALNAYEKIAKRAR